MNAKELFQKNKDLCTWWAQVVDDPRFDLVLLHAKHAFQPISMEHLSGCELFATTLKTLAAADDHGTNLLELASPGLHHNIDKPDNPS